MPPLTSAALPFVIVLIASGSAAAQFIPDQSQLPSPVAPAPVDVDHPAPCFIPPQNDLRGLWNANLWPGGIVPYQIDAAVTSQNATRLRDAMDELQSVANVTFVVRNGQTAFLHVQNGGGNSSSVGRIGGQQNVNLVSWSSRYVIVHELMHALGVWHEQQRSDRETYVTIVAANIQAGYEGNFNIRASATPHGPFDFESVMLYDDCSFSTCCPAGSTCNCPVSCATILAQPAYALQQNLMGNRSYLSQGDKDSLVSRYGASTCPTSATTPSSVVLCASGAASVTVAHDAGGPVAAVTYQWRRNGVDLADGGRISGATTATLTITGARAADVGSYTAVVSNACGAVTSTAAALTLCLADYDCNAHTNPADVAAMVNAWADSLAQGTLVGDIDGNGTVTPSDVAAFVSAWFAALSAGC